MKKKFFTNFKKHSCHIGCFVLMAGLFLTSCNKEQPVTNQQFTEEALTETTNNSSSLNPLGLTTYTHLENEAALNSTGDISLIGNIKKEAQLEEGVLEYIEILSYTEETILVSYTVNVSQKDTPQNPLSKHYLSSISRKDQTVNHTLFVDDSNTSLQMLDDKLVLLTSQNQTYTGTIYTLTLDEVSTFSHQKNGVISPHGKKYYYIQNRSLYMYDIENEKNTALPTKETFLAENIQYAVSDSNGADILIFSGTAANYKTYTFFLNAETGNILHIQKYADFFTLEKQTYVFLPNSEDASQQWVIGTKNQQAYEYCLNNPDDYNLHSVIDQENIMFYYTQDNKLFLSLFDSNTGQQKAHTFIETDKLNECLFLLGTPVFQNKDTLLLLLGDAKGDTSFVQWHLENATNEPTQMVVTKRTKDETLLKKFRSLKNELPTPGALSPELEPLLDMTTQLEEKYNIELFIGEEAAGVFENYNSYTLTNYQLIKDALTQIDNELQKYPKNFFNEFYYEEIQGLQFYLSGEIINRKNKDMITLGFHCIFENQHIIVMNANDTYGLRSTIHHELSHAIDTKLETMSMGNSDLSFSEDTWSSFLPFDNMYTNTYKKQGYKKYHKFSYIDRQVSDMVFTDTYFVDTYAMTFPTEDRARLFESVMSDAFFMIDFEQAPHLKEKLAYYAKCIREAFDSSQWDTVPWELETP